MNNISRITAAACLLMAAGAHAEDRLFLAGAEVANAAYYSYVGAIVPGAGRVDGHGLFQRYWLDGFGYEYDGAPGHVKAHAWGAEMSLGWGTSSPTGWASASAGLRFTDTSLSPNDPGATARGSQAGFKVQVDGEQRLGENWKLGAIASYTTRQDGYWARLRLMYRSAASQSTGLELVANGNNEADSTAAGLVYELRPNGSRWSIGLKAGYRWQQHADGLYGGIDLSHAF
jgi:hypothetical protein